MSVGNYQAEYIVIGIDPGTAITGYGVIAQSVQGSTDLLACGVIRTLAETPMHLRLRELFEDINRLIQEFQPNAIAVEKLFFGRNVTTAITVGQARGIILLAAAQNDLLLAEYTPAEVKQAICGYGNADKPQIQEMVRQTLGLKDIPRPDDAADGAAVALCHLQSRRYHLLTQSL